MKSAILLGVGGAFLAGMLIGTQATIGSRMGEAIGPIRVGLFMNIFGGSLAALLLLATIWFPIKEEGAMTPEVVKWLAIAGLLGIFIIAGTAFALPKVGVAAGLGTMIFAQMIVATVVDTFGIGGAEPIPLDVTRIAGLLVLGVAVYLLLPRG